MHVRMAMEKVDSSNSRPNNSDDVAVLDARPSGQSQAGFASPAGQTHHLAFLVLALVMLLYVGTCFAPVIFDDNEGLYAGAVREMHERGDWLMPTTNGFPRVQKPPLVYWTMLISTSLLGENEVALRLPNALATVGWIIATYLIMRRLGGERFGVASALVLASMLGVWVFNHLVQPEPFLACFISFAFWCLVEARGAATPNEKLRPQTAPPARLTRDLWYLHFWVFLALGTISKGLHGALWPLGSVLLTALIFPRCRPWLRPVLSARGFAIFLLLTFPWYAYMAMRLPGFLSAHFLNEQLGASLNTRYPVDAKQLPLAQFYLQHLLFWLPWTLLLPGAIFVAFKLRRSVIVSSAVNDVEKDGIKLLVCWISLTLVSVAFSTRQDYYSMSSWGIVAGFLALPWLAEERWSVRLPRAFLVVPCVCFFGAGLLALGLYGWLAPRLAGLGNATAAPIQQRDTFMDAIAGISPALWGHFLFLLAIFGAAMLVAGAWATVLSWRRRFYSALLVLSGAMAVPVCLATVGFTMMGPYFSLASEAKAIDAEITSQPQAIVACEALPNTASSLYYYLNARVHWVNAPFAQDYAQRVLGEGRDFYWNDDDLLHAWHSIQPVYLIIEQDRLDHWRGLLTRVRVVNESGTRLVLCNR